MTGETMARVLDWLAQTDIPIVDITGGAPELNPHFRTLVERVKVLSPSRHVLEEYQELLVNSFNLASVAGLMCRSTLNIGWRGEVYDCDFNQMLNLQWRNGKPLFLWDTKPEDVQNRPILTGDHCFGCTAGAGSSCGGAILPA